jgi:hypothetical protein
MAGGVLWNGDKVIAELKRLQVRNLRRAAIHLSRKIKENLSVSGRQTGIDKASIRKSQITREGRDERGRQSVTVSRGEFHRIADERNAARDERVRKTLEKRRLSVRAGKAFTRLRKRASKIGKRAKKLGKRIKKFFPKRRRGRR